jgi:hypothetical protein
VQAVPALQLADHVIVWIVRGLLVDDRLVQVGVERLADRFDGRHALGLEDVAQLPLHQPDALDPRVVGLLGGNGLERPVEVVEDAKQLADEDRVAEPDERLALLLGPALVVGKVRGRPMPVVAMLGLAVGGFLELALELLDALSELESRRRRDGIRTLLGARLRPRPRTAVRRVVSHWVSP